MFPRIAGLGLSATQLRRFQIPRSWTRISSLINRYKSFASNCASGAISGYMVYQLSQLRHLRYGNRRYDTGFHLICIKQLLKKLIFLFQVIQVIRGRWRSLEDQTLDLLLLLYSWGSQLQFDMHKVIVKTFSFLEVIQVIRGRNRSLEGRPLFVDALLGSC